MKHDEFISQLSASRFYKHVPIAGKRVPKPASQGAELMQVKRGNGRRGGSHGCNVVMKSDRCRVGVASNGIISTLRA